MKIIIALILTIGLMPILAFGQIDEARMAKDLRVAAKVLETLWQGEGNVVMYENNVEGNYIAGYGVIFTIGSQYSVFYNPAIVTPADDKAQGPAEKAGADHSRAAGQNKMVTAGNTVSEFSDDYNVKIAEVDLEAVMTGFLIDYSQMIGQLQPADKIVVTTKKSDYVYETPGKNTPGPTGTKTVVAEMVKQDHSEYVNGNLSRAQLLEKIVINKSNGDTQRSKDLDMFASMLKTVYDAEFTDSFFMTWKPEYQRLTGVGAIYTAKVYSSYDENGLFRMPAINQRGLTAAERNEKVEQLYPVFLTGIKESMIQYGRTINSLADNELLMLKVTMTKCDDCSLPAKVQLSVKQSVLKAYNTGSLSLQEAVDQVMVSEL